MKKLFLVFAFASHLLSAQQFPLSDEAEISVITIGPYQGELYSAFGHSSFRVFDPKARFDAAYNYGVFNFNQPNFYLNFTRGYLYYQLGVYDYPSFEAHYIEQDRYFHEQVLDLTPDQKQKLFDYLQWNAMPENSFYRYDYFYNNCATKMRDVVKYVLQDSVRFDESHIETKYTIRDLTDLYLKEQPWGDLGIDICLGLPMDKVATPDEYMFLPDYVEAGFDRAYIKKNGVEVPIVKTKNIIHDSRAQVAAQQRYGPLIVFSIVTLLIATITFFDFRKKRLSNWLDGILFGVTGAIGILLFVLWFFTDHNAAARNMNILWAFPLHFVAAIALIKSPRWLRPYFLGTAVLSLLLLLCWAILPQQLHIALIPVVVAQGVRSFAQYRIRKARL